MTRPATGATNASLRPEVDIGLLSAACYRGFHVSSPVCGALIPRPEDGSALVVSLHITSCRRSPRTPERAAVTQSATMRQRARR